MSPIELITALGLVITLVTAIAGAAWLVGSRVVEAVRRFDALGHTVGELREAVDANTRTLNNGLRSDVRQHGVEIRRLVEMHAHDQAAVEREINDLKGRLTLLKCHSDCPETAS
jgi:hypothetical protein